MNIKIYFNHCCLEITNNKAVPKERGTKACLLEKITVKQVMEIKNEFLTSKRLHRIVIVCNNVKRVYELLKKSFKYIEAAGGFIEKNKKYLSIHRHGQWDLPKGKREKKESLKQCAMRECEEECGVKELKVIKSLNPSYHVYKYKNTYALKKSYWFYMTTSYNKKLTPQTEENIDIVKWFGKREIVTRILPDTYPTIAGVIKEGLSLYAE